MDAELHRLRGELHWQESPNDLAAAEGDLRSALEIAVAQRSQTFEALAAASLARLYQATGRGEVAPLLI